MWQKIKRFAGLCTLIIFSISAHAAAQVPCEYDVQIIQAPVDCGVFGTLITIGSGLNEHGAVVGYYKCPGATFFQGFVWTAEDGYELLDPPTGVVEVIPADINDNGVICGTLNVAALSNRGFVYDHGKWTILNPVVPDGGWASASAINNTGVVVGQRSLTENLNPQNAYFWSVEKGFTDLGVMNGPNSAATDINEKGDVCGWTGGGLFTLDSRAFLWHDGKLTVLGSVPDGLQSTALAICDDAAIVGSGAIPMDGFPFGIPRAFLWQKGKFSMLGTLPGHLVSRAQDFRINPLQIVGRSSYVDGIPSVAHGFLWENGIMYDINDLTVPNSQALIKSTGGITSMGDIVANGVEARGNIVAFLLTPTKDLNGDLDNDCDVDLDDLIALLDNWGKHDSPADLNQDGLVNTVDLLILFANWG